MHEPPSMHCWPKHLPRASVDGPVALAGTNRQLLFHTAFLDSYGTRLTLDEVNARVGVLIDDQIQLMRQYASVGDATYQRMLEHGRGHDLEIARRELLEV
jgi:hypothetical protein